MAVKERLEFLQIRNVVLFFIRHWLGVHCLNGRSIFLQKGVQCADASRTRREQVALAEVKGQKIDLDRGRGEKIDEKQETAIILHEGGSHFVDADCTGHIRRECSRWRWENDHLRLCERRWSNDSDHRTTSSVDSLKEDSGLLLSHPLSIELRCPF